MTVAVSTRKNKHVGNNTTDTYAYTFRIDDESELVVQEIVRATNVVTTLTLNTDYTVTGVDSDSGGTVVLDAGNLAAANDLLIYAATDIEQNTSIRNQSTFYGRIHEAFFDRITRIVQELNTKLSRSIKLEAHVAGISGDIEGTPTADYYIGLNATADGFEYKAPPSNGATGATGATGPAGAAGPAGADGEGVPTGGTSGQLLTKVDGTDFNTSWEDAPVALPVGGTAGQLLKKNSITDGDASWATGAKGDVGLGNVDNTADADKPVSTAQQTALDLKANLASPTFTGNPAGPTPTVGDNDTSLATTAFVNTAIGEKRPSPTNFSTTSVTPTTRAMDETFVFNGGASVTMTSTPMGSLSGFTNGYRARFIGTSDSFFPTFNESDASDGILLSGPAELQRGRVLDVEYNSTIGRLVETLRNF